MLASSVHPYSCLDLCIFWTAQCVTMSGVGDCSQSSVCNSTFICSPPSDAGEQCQQNGKPTVLCVGPTCRRQNTWVKRLRHLAMLLSTCFRVFCRLICWRVTDGLLLAVDCASGLVCDSTNTCAVGFVTGSNCNTTGQSDLKQPGSLHWPSFPSLTTSCV